MVFYFSGTGNSQYLAQRIAEATGDGLVSISAAIKDGEYSFSCDSAGFVFPVYFFGLPQIVARFISKLELNSRYVYCALTCGGSTGDAAHRLAELLRARGVSLDASYSVAMVDNYVPMFSIASPEEAAARLEKAEPVIADICKDVAARTMGDMDQCKGALPKLKTSLLYPLYEPCRSTRKFRVTEGCTGCGLCWRVCPEEAIKLTDDRPRWVKDKCSKCLACLHRCPAAAIQHGSSTKRRRRYVNPRVDLRL